MPEHTREQLAQRGVGARHVFEHLDGEHQIERIIDEREGGAVAEQARDVGAAPVARQLGVGKVESDHRDVGEPIT